MGRPKLQLTTEERKARKKSQAKAASEKWRRAHPEYFRSPKYYAHIKAWQKRNPERVRASRLRTKARNREKIRAYEKRRRLEHPENVKAIHKRWNDNNPDRLLIYVENRRARKLMAPGDGVSAGQWREIKDVFGQRCAYCLKKTERLTQDHVIALSKGGAHDVDNVIPACKSCNCRKGPRGVLRMVNIQPTTPAT
jgi:5-methylcytosine-specific restriction endonuclease McrA